MSDTFEKPKRYVPGPGDPALPPQLAQLASKSTDDVMKELNRLPFFMTQLDESDGSGGENLELEALKALAYDGEPHEVATNFKNQGNEQYKIKNYKSAIEFYNQGLSVKCGDADIDSTLYLNRAACNLELKNYRKCINDCKECLKLNPKNIKAYYRLAKAFFSIEKYDEAQQAIEFSLKIDPENSAANAFLVQIINKKKQIQQAIFNKEVEKQRAELVKENLANALKQRGYTNINTPSPADLFNDAKISLEDPNDIESQLIIPAMIMYPTTGEFDFVAQISELNTPEELMEMILQRPSEWFEDPRHENFTVKKLDAYMETESGGLIKVGKKATLNKALSTPKPKVPLFDNALRIYFVPRIEAEGWLSKWDKEVALKKRVFNK